MDIYNAIMKAAGHIERHPEEFNFFSAAVPSKEHCGTPGCALGWIASFHRGALANCTSVRPLAMGLESDSAFYRRMDEVTGSGQWKHYAGPCANGLRLYAAKYHAPAKVPDWNAIASKQTIGEHERSQELA